MKITFEDQSYIEIVKSDNPGHILITIQARDHENKLKKITNCVEVSEEEFKQLVSDI